MKLFTVRSSFLLSLLFFTGITVFAQRKKTARKNVSHAAENNPVRNGIKFKSKDFKVTEAYLVFDDESLVPEDNAIELNQHVNLVLIIDGGWTETGGRVFPGSKQVIKLDNGMEILNSEELFAAFDETGVSPEDARYINLNAVITDIKDKKNHAIVNFNVWDKKGAAEITGSYKLYLK